MPKAYESLNLVGRVMIVTGGSGGLGSATAKLCASRGASVVITDLDDAAGEQLVAAIEGQGGKAVYIHADVTSERDVRAMVEFAVSTFGGLHAAFNNAGIDNGHKTVVDLKLAEWQRNIDVNLTGVFLCMKYEIEYMLRHGGGAIVNTSSAAGAVGVANAVGYVSAKHGVVGLSRATAVDYAAKGVRVNAILPGSVETPMLQNAFQDQALREMVTRCHPMGRVGRAPEIAETVAWLLSDAASFVTGASIMVDGGFTTC